MTVSDESKAFSREMDESFVQMRAHLAIISVDKFLVEVFDRDVLPNAEWEHVTSYKFNRKCLLTKNLIMPFTKVYKGTLRHENKERVIWVSEGEMLFRKLKGDFNEV